MQIDFSVVLVDPFSIVTFFFCFSLFSVVVSALFVLILKAIKCIFAPDDDGPDDADF